MAHKVYEPLPHKPGLEREIVWTVGVYAPTTIGEIPEIASAFNILFNQINSAKSIDLNKITEQTPDLELDWEILPVGTIDEVERSDSSRTSRTSGRDQYRNIGLLFQLRDEFRERSSSDKSIVVSVGLRNRDKKTGENRQNPYMAALLFDESDQLYAVVADSKDEDNSLFVWRPDAVEMSPEKWVEVFQGTKHEARNSLAVDVRHRGERFGERVLRLLQMTDEEFLDVVTSPAGKRPRLSK